MKEITVAENSDGIEDARIITRGYYANAELFPLPCVLPGRKKEVGKLYPVVFKEDEKHPQKMKKKEF